MMDRAARNAVKAATDFERAEARLARAMSAYLKARARMGRYARQQEKGLGGQYHVRELAK